MKIGKREKEEEKKRIINWKKKRLVVATSHLMSILASMKQVIFSHKKFLNSIY